MNILTALRLIVDESECYCTDIGSAVTHPCGYCVAKSALKDNDKPTEYETRKVAVISTSHVTEKDAELLNSQALSPWNTTPCLTLVGEYGWQFTTSADGMTHERVEENWRRFGFSNRIPSILAHFKSLGFDRVEFDQDGPVIPSFPTFDW